MVDGFPIRLVYQRAGWSEYTGCYKCYVVAIKRRQLQKRNDLCVHIHRDGTDIDTVVLNSVPTVSR